MALPNITFNRGQGGLGRPLAGGDHISGLIFYVPTMWTIPAGVDNDVINEIYSLEELEDLGVNGDSMDETKSTGDITVTAIGSNGDVVTYSVTDDRGNVTELCSYTKVSGDTTTTLVATAVKNAINANTYIHGFTATSNTNVVTVTAPAGYGVRGDSFTTSKVVTGTITSTEGSWSGGVGSYMNILHYHVSEFFRMQPKGVLYVMVTAAGGSTYSTFAEITTVQNAAGGAIRQMGVYGVTTAFATSHVTALQAQATSLAALNKPLSIIYQGDFSAVTTLSSLSSVRALTANNVSVCFGQDGAGTGNDLFDARAKSVGILGLALGAVAFAKVSESIAWVSKFPVHTATEFDTIAFANGAAYSSQSDNTIEGINTKGYIFIRDFVGIEGAYFNDTHTAISVSSDYAYIEDNRTIDKAIRNMRSGVLPALNSPLRVNSDGTLNEGTIAYFKSLCDKELKAMEANGELSFSQVNIDPTQNVVSTSTLTIAAELGKIGVARNIVINVGFTLAL